MKDVDEKIDLTIGNDSKITGDLKSKGSIRIDGEIIGNINCVGMIIIGDKGSIKGNITASQGVIGGTIEGNLKLKNYLELNSTAKVFGDIEAELLQIDKGAVFNGKCITGPISKKIEKK
ncbi:polymer-forming cytoskeletal protein [bacterium]|nr:polymer-forming cytoskeletal protein [bacterium]